MNARTYRHERLYTLFSMCGGAGGQTAGFLQAECVHDGVRASFRSLGSIDSEAIACASFERLTGSTSHCIDLRDRQQFIDMEGGEPPKGWTEFTPADLLALVPVGPDVLITSAPCRGLSALNSHRREAKRYRALNRLTERTLYLALTGWGQLGGKYPRLILIENVPGLAGKPGRKLLGHLQGMLEAEGYAVGVRVYDCGELSGLAQSRKRCLIYARHAASTEANLFQMRPKGLRGIGEVLGDLPLPLRFPGHVHSLPAITEQTQMRLALVPAGKDWRALKELTIEDGHVVGWSKRELRADVRPCPAPPVTEHGSHQPYGVLASGTPAHTITSRFGPGAGFYSWADERIVAPAIPGGWGGTGRYAVTEWEDHTGTVIATYSATGAQAVADVRLPSDAYRGVLGVVDGDQPLGVITAEGRPYNGAFSVADDRVGALVDEATAILDVSISGAFRGSLGVVDAASPMGTITAEGLPTNGPFSIADPRLDSTAQNHAYRVSSWEEPSGAVSCGGSPRSGGRMVQELRLEGVACARPPRVYLIAPDDLGERLDEALVQLRYGQHAGKMRVERWEAASHTITCSDRVGSGLSSIPDPRARFMRGDGPRASWDNAGFYGVLEDDDYAGAVTCQPKVDNGRWARAVPPEWCGDWAPDGDAEPLDVYIRVDTDSDGNLRLAEHRPITVLEAGVLQGLIPEQVLDLEGSITQLRRQIGNMVPVTTARDLGNLALDVLLRSDAGLGWQLDTREVWVGGDIDGLWGMMLPYGAQGTVPGVLPC